MGDKLIMSQKERLRKVIFEQVKLGELTQVDAATRLNLSYRHTKRIYQRFLREGDAGLIHQSRGKRSTRAYPEDTKQTMMKLYRDKYDGFGPTLAAEKLSEDDGYSVHHETLRLWLKSEGLWLRRRKRKQHRQRRERRARFGALLQLDGSIHRWFADNPEHQCLMNMVDDATGKTLSLLDTGETTFAAFSLLRWWIELHGIPLAIYVDLKNVYVSPKSLNQEQGSPTEPEWFTHFSLACRRLGIDVIKAYSPQAKGRVERNHAVYQDRLVKELKLKGISNIDAANACLRDGFIDKLNQKFAKPPRSDIDAHVPLMPENDLNQILCWEYPRVLTNDWVVRCHNQYYQISKQHQHAVMPKQQVMVRYHLDKQVTLWHSDTQLMYTLIEAPPSKAETPTQKRVYTSEQRATNARKNKHKTPWSQMNANWLTPTKTSSKSSINTKQTAVV